MTSALYQFSIELKLYFRNRMALLYGYLFPTIFLVAFWMLYRHESVPLVNHMGELLTVTALGGACFGLPTSMVSERERGVWRRYRLAPVSTLRILLCTLAARYVILISAAVLQVMLAIWIGMPFPDRPLDLWAAFTLVSFAFLGLGLVIAMLADTVPAVQALGQSIFLPMLIIGGVAVRIESLPSWAQHLSAFFPGRYSVEALQAGVDGPGLHGVWFSLMALLLVGAAACTTAAKLFRWDVHERFVTRAGKGWIAVALAAWVSVGLLAEATGRIRPSLASTERAAAAELRQGAVGPEQRADSLETSLSADSTGLLEEAGSPTASGRDAGAQDEEQDGNLRSDRPDPSAPETGAREQAAEGQESALGHDRAAAEADAAVDQDAADSDQSAARAPSSWRDVRPAHVDRNIAFGELPSDKGLETPIAEEDEPLYRDMEQLMNCIRATLPRWTPAGADDPVQRARNVLYVAALPDMYQMSGIERWVPLVVFDHLKETFPQDQLVQVLYWIATHPDEGDVAAAGTVKQVCLDLNAPENVDMLQQRTGWYAAKLLGRLTGHID